jgi:hypothetical protein
MRTSQINPPRVTLLTVVPLASKCVLKAIKEDFG